MKRLLRTITCGQQISTPSLYSGLCVRDMSDIDTYQKTVDHVENKERGLYQIFFTDGTSGIYDTQDKFEIVD